MITFYMRFTRLLLPSPLEAPQEFPSSYHPPRSERRERVNRETEESFPRQMGLGLILEIIILLLDSRLSPRTQDEWTSNPYVRLHTHNKSEIRGQGQYEYQ